jgi:hypothetical protein
MRNLVLIALTAIGITFSSAVYSQCDSVAKHCQAHLGNQYISDGQQYRALLTGDEVAEFEATFFGGSKYRLCACTGGVDGSLVFRVYDIERNLIFDNNDYKNVSFWDFEFKSTMDCIIEVQLESMGSPSGCALLLIGFER